MKVLKDEANMKLNVNIINIFHFLLEYLFNSLHLKSQALNEICLIGELKLRNSAYLRADLKRDNYLNALLS
ncbi:CLUMA_CG008358, isoform A [Clunio marinus]|uniref:CLUMA_CG008358, isoform A n=1 Tax=Clunio marinus TaxID=568069 RepID=A0A1J1I533_9DIPT|nr:CLUMA_CG008358, isoform A [Clunio marinus]